jgi:hypothetical protein
MDILKDPSYVCKIMLHIEFLGYTYDSLKDYMVHYYPKSYNLRTGSGIDKKRFYQKYIMIACNY